MRAFGCFAQEVADAGVPGVVAMRYNIYPRTAARFVAGLHRALAAGESLGEAVTRGRNDLNQLPGRWALRVPRNQIEDWYVPVVYEQFPLALFAKTDATSHSVSSKASFTENPDHLSFVPSPPEIGFHGTGGVEDRVGDLANAAQEQRDTV